MIFILFSVAILISSHLLFLKVFHFHFSSHLVMYSDMYIYVMILILFSVSQLLGQTALLSGTNYASGSGFCFGDQQLKEGPPFISCTHSGFTGTVAALSIAWTFDGTSTVPNGDAVDSMFAGRIDAVNMQPVGGRLNILNVTNLGVSSVACRITAFDDVGTFLGQTPLSATASISVVNSK